MNHIRPHLSTLLKPHRNQYLNIDPSCYISISLFLSFFNIYRFSYTFYTFNIYGLCQNSPTHFKLSFQLLNESNLIELQLLNFFLQIFFYLFFLEKVQHNKSYKHFQNIFLLS
jgi:hypothetical protein